MTLGLGFQTARICASDLSLGLEPRTCASELSLGVELGGEPRSCASELSLERAYNIGCWEHGFEDGFGEVGGVGRASILSIPIEDK